MPLSPALSPRGEGERPAHALRLFPGHEESGLDPASPQVIARLFEDGDARDLAWLTAAVPEARLAAWLGRHGGRQLSRRSRAFWETVLGRPASPPSGIGSALWPL
ncbi:MAG TPA: hypothetical protein VEW48_12910 [Thermoanaerobaculia bacterium]|nr:hypothetical protein [Thermoanaerobaculia bacterium]